MRRKWPILFILILVTCLLSGCGFKDIDKRFFVVAVAVDKSETSGKKYRITTKLAIPSPRERFGSNNYILLSEDTNSLAEAVRLMKAKVDKEMDFGHCKMIVFGQDVVRSEDMKKVLDWFTRRRDIQEVAYVAMGNPTGKTILDRKPS